LILGNHASFILDSCSRPTFDLYFILNVKLHKINTPMKTTIKKFAVTGLLGLALILPQLSYAQDSTSQIPPPPQDNSQAPAPQDNSQPMPPQNDQQPYDNPPATPPNPNDQQLDQQEAQQAAPPSSQPITTQVFYDQLTPYGQWVNDPQYGYVWIPSAVPNFTPYSTEGHWVYTTYGWTWVSDYPWGWATFHYGRWAYDNAYGWLWVPGTQWGPAWVAWRQCNGYYGWAPLTPGLDISIGFNWNSIPANNWCFVNERYIGDRNVSRYYEPRYNNVTFIRSSTIISNTYYDRGRGATYSAGPQRTDVERAMHTSINPVPVRESAQPEQRYDQAHLHLYRPTVSAPPANVHPAPSRSVPIQQVPQRNVQYNAQQPNNWHSTAQNQAPAQRQQPMRQQQQPQARQAAPARSGGNGSGNNYGNSKR
jgi:hypothetical protein